MFGRLNEEKRAKAVDLMNEMIHEMAGILMFWSTDKNTFLTPTKPYLDELYVLSSMAIVLPYLSWRKKRQDAYEDVVLASHNIYSEVFEKHISDWPFKVDTNNKGEFIGAIGDLMDLRFKEYEIAVHDQLVNIEAEVKKYRHSHGGYSDMDELMGASMAEHPFRDLVIRHVFDVDPMNRDKSADYGQWASQVLSLMSKRGDVFTQYLKRL